MKRPIRSIVHFSKHACIFTAITLGTTRCANTSDGQLAQGQGAAIGAGVGALAGNLIGGDTQGTLIGAGIGSALGFAYGSHVANKKADYRNTEDWLDACIVQAEGKRKEAVAYNDRLNRELTRLRREVAAAKAANDRKKLASLNRQIGSERAAAQKQSAAFSKEAQVNRSAIKEAGGEGGSKLSSLRSTTSGIETQVSKMNKTEQSLASLQNETDV